LPEGGGMLPPEPGREPGGSGGRVSPFPPGLLPTATYFLAGPAVTFSKYHASRLLRRLRRLDDANSFLLGEHTLASGYGD
jgi:hypothetical protein